MYQEHFLQDCFGRIFKVPPPPKPYKPGSTPLKEPIPISNKNFKQKPVAVKLPLQGANIAVGAEVIWEVNSKKRGGAPPFNANGKIIKLYETTFGGRVKKQAAKVATSGRYLDIFPSRKHTTVAVDKLTVVANPDGQG